MASTVPHVDQPGDAELISAVRGGDVDAYGQLFERHVGSARRLARQLVSPGEADDLVSEAFVKVLGVLQRGGGPDVAFRAYLLTAIRRLRVDRLRAGSRLQTTDDMDVFDPGVPFRDTAVEGFESTAAARAFASLPERWQLVLWHTEVEGHRPADVAPLLGMTPNSVSALAYRAREGLRQAFLNEHAVEAEDDLCRWTHQHLGGYVRRGLSRRDTARVEGHLGECRRCAAIYLELTEVNDNLAGLLAPLLLGTLATGYLAAGHGTATTGVLLTLLGRVRDGVIAHTGASVAGGVVTAGVVAGGGWWAVHDAPPPPTTSASPVTEPGGDAGADRPGGPARGRSAPRTGTAGPVAPSPAPSSDSSSGPSSGPSSGSAGASGPSDSITPTPQEGETRADRPGASGADQAEEAPGSAGGDLSGAGEPPPVDLRVSASATGAGPQYDLTATVGGIASGGPATLTVETEGVTALTSSSCSPGAGLTLTCRLTADGSVAIRAVAPTGGAVTFSVAGASPDADPSDNTTSVTLD